MGLNISDAMGVLRRREGKAEKEGKKEEQDLMLCIDGCLNIYLELCRLGWVYEEIADRANEIAARQVGAGSRRRAKVYGRNDVKQPLFAAFYGKPSHMASSPVGQALRDLWPVAHGGRGSVLDTARVRGAGACTRAGACGNGREPGFFKKCGAAGFKVRELVREHFATAPNFLGFPHPCLPSVSSLYTFTYFAIQSVFGSIERE